MVVKSAFIDMTWKSKLKVDDYMKQSTFCKWTDLQKEFARDYLLNEGLVNSRH